MLWESICGNAKRQKWRPRQTTEQLGGEERTVKNRTKLRTTCKKTAGQRLAENARCMEMRQPSILPSPSKREETARASCDKS